MKCRDGKLKALLLCLIFIVERRGKERNSEVRVPSHPGAELPGWEIVRFILSHTDRYGTVQMVGSNGRLDWIW